MAIFAAPFAAFQAASRRSEWLRLFEQNPVFISVSFWSMDQSRKKQKNVYFQRPHLLGKVRSHFVFLCPRNRIGTLAILVSPSIQPVQAACPGKEGLIKHESETT
ncbi:hypothetical protein [uncultured Allobaculum sp.]|uniref:hypothetical protein n=1 Tax=uncultured Allobaculum sp. TaxID=1187017 RepID=UPI00259236C1|nr:hypothetical protein [uncultured Allobaculum sp.]